MLVCSVAEEAKDTIIASERVSLLGGDKYGKMGGLGKARTGSIVESGMKSVTNSHAIVR